MSANRPAVVMCAVVFALASSLCSAQSVDKVRDTAAVLTADMRLLDAALLGRARAVLEHDGNTFLSYAMYVPDSASEFPIMEIGEESFLPSREARAHRDSLRNAARKHQSYESSARTIGIITDSISGPVEEAVDGAEGPPFRRTAITELEDRSGVCARVERDYRFVKDSASDGGFGSVVFDSARVRSCVPFGFWPPDSSRTNEVPSRPHLAQPIVRSLEISSIGNYFSVVGRFRGKLTVFDDSIVVRLDTLVARRQFPNDPARIRLDSIRVGVGVGDEKTWNPVDDSKALRVGRILTGDATFIRRNVRFLIRHQRLESDPDSWIVVTFHITVGRKGEARYLPQATTYAHSRKGVLAEDR